MKLLWSIFAGVGGLFVAIAILLFVLDQRFFADAVRTEGEVVHVRFNSKGSGAPQIAYADGNGLQHVFSSNTYSRPSYRVGDRVPIAFDPDDPGNAAIDRTSDRWLLPGIFGAIGFVQFSFGLFGLLRRARRKREIAWLLREGQRVDATVTAITQDTSIRVNRKSPWVLHCEATLPGDSAPRTFVSRRFWYEPGRRLLRTSMTVCYDPRDPARHVVDTGDLDPRQRS
ncbi:DUF3592 domain-containing protein [Nannocystis radixulma]|uniref:DUF3592 domain-containing protein n=1 Tax=Nannocystis radixulma TaxID=2995305 RepID=A0ABT5BJH7_9BACT|nr:DUF3592 domain-containing protein [Nannocystis radixulma]MDC0673162.1 DUF3592 domain-containing protein [Nannocystis radixulma]